MIPSSTWPPRLNDSSVESPDSMRAGNVRCWVLPTAVTCATLTMRGADSTVGAF